MNKKQKVPKEKTQAAAKENKVPSVLLVLGCAGLVVVVLCLIVSVATEGKKPQAKGGKLIETIPNKVVTFEDMEKEESEEQRNRGDGGHWRAAYQSFAVDC